MKDLSTLTDSDKEFLLNFKNYKLRLLMSSQEIKRANKFVKMELMVKGTAEGKRGTVIYYTDSHIWSKL